MRKMMSTQNLKYLFTKHLYCHWAKKNYTRNSFKKKKKREKRNYHLISADVIWPRNYYTFTFEPIRQWRPMTDRLTLHLSPICEPSPNIQCGPTWKPSNHSISTTLMGYTFPNTVDKIQEIKQTWEPVERVCKCSTHSCFRSKLRWRMNDVILCRERITWQISSLSYDLAIKRMWKCLNHSMKPCTERRKRESIERQNKEYKDEGKLIL